MITFINILRIWGSAYIIYGPLSLHLFHTWNVCMAFISHLECMLLSLHLECMLLLSHLECMYDIQHMNIKMGRTYVQWQHMDMKMLIQTWKLF